MRNSIIAEEELTHKVLAGLKNNFAVSGLGRSLYVFLQEGVDALATISAVANFDRMKMVAKMNAGTLSAVIAMDVEDFGMAWGNALGRLLTYIQQIKVEPKSKGPPTENGCFVRPSKSVSLRVEVR